MVGRWSTLWFLNEPMIQGGRRAEPKRTVNNLDCRVHSIIPVVVVVVVVLVIVVVVVVDF